MKLMLKMVRAAFPVFFTPKAFGDGDPTFSVLGILPKDHPQIGELNDLMENVAKDKWGKDAAAIMKTMKAKDRLCLHDGDTKAKYAGFENNLFISARSRQRPFVCDGSRNELNAQDGKPYAGCYVNLLLDVYAQDNEYGQRINANLRAAQFAGHGEPFSGSGGSVSADEFDVLDDSDDSLEDLI
jgi:hypothetical protein